MKNSTPHTHAIRYLTALLSLMLATVQQITFDYMDNVGGSLKEYLEGSECAEGFYWC